MLSSQENPPISEGQAACKDQPIIIWGFDVLGNKWTRRWQKNFPISENRVVCQDHTKTFAVWDVLENKFIQNLSLEDYPPSTDSPDTNIIPSADQSHFVLCYHSNSKKYPTKTIIKIFDTTSLVCQRTHTFAYGEFDVNSARIVGNKLISLFHSPTYSGTKTLISIEYQNYICFRKIILRIPVSDDNFYPRELCALTPNILAELTLSTITLYEIDGKRSHVLKFPEAVKLPKSYYDKWHNLHICYSPDSSQACLYSSEKNTSRIDHLELVNTNKKRFCPFSSSSSFDYRHLGSYIFENRTSLKLFWTQQNILYAFSKVVKEDSFAVRQLSTLDHQKKFKEKILKKFTYQEDLEELANDKIWNPRLFTPNGRTIHCTNEFILLPEIIALVVQSFPTALISLIAEYAFDSQLLSKKGYLTSEMKQGQMLTINKLR